MKTEILIEKNLRIIYNRPLTEDFLLKAGQWLPKFNWERNSEWWPKKRSTRNYDFPTPILHDYCVKTDYENTFSENSLQKSLNLKLLSSEKYHLLACSGANLTTEQGSHKVLLSGAYRGLVYLLDISSQTSACTSIRL